MGPFGPGLLRILSQGRGSHHCRVPGPAPKKDPVPGAGSPEGFSSPDVGGPGNPGFPGLSAACSLHFWHRMIVFLGKRASGGHVFGEARMPETIAKRVVGHRDRELDPCGLVRNADGSGAGEVPEQEAICNKVRAGELAESIQMLPFTLAMSVVISSVLVVVLWNSLPQSRLLTWYLVHHSVTLWRALKIRSYHRQQPRPHEIGPWIRQYTFSNLQRACSHRLAL